MKIELLTPASQLRACPTAALLLTALLALAALPSTAEAAAQNSNLSSTNLSSTQNTAPGAAKPAPQANSQAPQAKSNTPQAKSRAEFDAYQSAAAEVEPAKLEAAATGFAQRYPASQLRPFLFQRAMALYQQANQSGKALEMARAVLKYDPGNAVALLCAAQILAEGTNEHDLDHDARLQEANGDAEAALQHAGDLPQPAGLSAEQFESAIRELRGAAHEVLATVAYKKRDFRKAIAEYNAAVAGEEEHTEPLVWLRLAAAHDKMGEYNLGIAAAGKAIAASEEGTPMRELAEKEDARLKALAAKSASGLAATSVAAPAATPDATPAASRPVEKTENSRSSAAGN